MHPTHGARGNGYLVEMCCLPSCLEDTAPPETGRSARNDRKVIIAPPLSTVLSLDYYKVQGQEAFRKLPSFPPPSVTIMDSLGFAAAAFLVPQAPSSWASALIHFECGKFGGGFANKE